MPPKKPAANSKVSVGGCVGVDGDVMGKKEKEREKKKREKKKIFSFC
jgi:hypothetical protein